VVKDRYEEADSHATVAKVVVEDLDDRSKDDRYAPTVDEGEDVLEVFETATLDAVVGNWAEEANAWYCLHVVHYLMGAIEAGEDQEEGWDEDALPLAAQCPLLCFVQVQANTAATAMNGAVWESGFPQACGLHKHNTGSSRRAHLRLGVQQADVLVMCSVSGIGCASIGFGEV
jgi:hypothetical protein